MMTIKIVTWSTSGVEMTTLIETSDYPIEIQKWSYTTDKEYRTLMDEKFNMGEIPFNTYGEWPRDNKLAYYRQFLYVTYFNLKGDYFSFVVNYGYLYVMQDGKTVQKEFIRAQNDEPSEEKQPISNQ